MINKTTVLTTFLILASIIFIFWFVKKEDQLQLNSDQWISTEATITQSKISQRRDKNGGAQRNLYKVELNYSYAVQNDIYIGERYAFHESLTFKSKNAAEKILAKYPTGKKISVYYMPSNPKESVILR